MEGVRNIPEKGTILEMKTISVVYPFPIS